MNELRRNIPRAKAYPTPADQVLHGLKDRQPREDLLYELCERTGWN